MRQKKKVPKYVITPASHVDVRHWRDGREFKLELRESLVVDLGLDVPMQNVRIESNSGAVVAECWPGQGDIYLLPGYAWDGASGPAIDTDKWIVPSAVHDFFYQCSRLGYTISRAHADRVMYNLLRQEGMHPLRAWWSWAGVRLGGRSSAKKRSL